MHKKLIYLLLFVGFSALTHAQDPEAKLGIKPWNKVFLSFGGHTEFYNSVQIDTSGNTRKFDFAPTLGAGLHFPINDEFSFLPELNWVLPRQVGEERIIKNLVMFRVDWGYRPVKWFRLRTGTSIMWLNQHGRGGSTQVNNGNTTSTFYYPEENRSSVNNTLDLGAEVLYDHWAVRLQTYIYSVFREDRRQLSYTLLLSYYWDR